MAYLSKKGRRSVTNARDTPTVQPGLSLTRKTLGRARTVQSQQTAAVDHVFARTSSDDPSHTSLTDVPRTITIYAGARVVGISAARRAGCGAVQTLPDITADQ
ncbi:hypothetical protein BDV23DRAFT_181428 [Aspergillus alliaceus]|uniref:Uncharacterized protein n=1 Tax=Petromyces alliaceus TaxID=209559 RepID=A0A5N7CEB8_PETAA|nr:hypothetical protein BDV23DRAFT_181428 [Aspergillus alliaceus]